jgi:hypothetical protein
MSSSSAPVGDDGVRFANSSTPTPPITKALAAELPKLNPEIAQRVRDVVARKS